MIIVIDGLEETTGWSGSGGAAVHGMNSHKDYCADWRESSVLFSFSGGAVSKTYPSIDVSGYEDIVLSLWSRNRGRSSHKKAADFSYKIVVNGTKEWYLPVHKSFTSVTVPLDGITEITSISIEATTGNNDYLTASSLYAVKDEYPLDVMNGVLSALEHARGAKYPNGLHVTDVDTSSGSEEVEIGWSEAFVERYSVVRISDGVNTEFHQVESRNGARISFTDNYDGKAIINDFTAADMALWFPVEIDRYQEEAVVPGIVVYAMVPEPAQTDSELATIRDGYSPDGTASERREHMLLEYPVLISCETRHGLVGAMQNRIVRWMLGENRVWINGRAHDIEFDQSPVATEPQGADVVAQVQYTVMVKVREERAHRVVQNNAGAASIDVVVE